MKLRTSSALLNINPPGTGPSVGNHSVTRALLGSM
jgi:hypothetical protein